MAKKSQTNKDEIVKIRADFTISSSGDKVTTFLKGTLEECYESFCLEHKRLQESHGCKVLGVSGNCM